MNPVVFSSNSDEWLTPPLIINSVIDVFERICLDPASDMLHSVPAHTHFDIETDGLCANWGMYDTVYINPPYTRNAVTKWIDKALKTYSESGNDIIMLLPARTSNKWFHKLKEQDPYICFIKGRLTFSNAANNAPFPSMVVYLGEGYEREFIEVFSSIGWVMRECSSYLV